MDQSPRHRLACDVLVAAGGVPVEQVLPPLAGQSRADVLFADHRIIAEVKDIAPERATDPRVEQAISDFITTKGPAMGGPVIFGQMTLRLDQLPDPLARRALRMLTKRVQTEVTKANRQIKHTRAALDLEGAAGLLVVITHPTRINLRVIGWAVHDALRGGQNSSIDCLLLIGRGPASGSGQSADYLSLHGGRGYVLPDALAQAIGQAWGKVTQQRVIEADESEFFRRYP